MLMYRRSLGYIYFVGKVLTVEEGEETGFPGKTLMTSYRKCHILKPQPRLEPAL